MPLDTSAADFLFKKMYPGGVDEEALVRDNPMMKWASHETDFTSHKGIEIPVPYVNPQGIGATNADANVAESPSGGASFTVPQRHITALGRIDGDVVRNAMAGGDASQFASALEREVDGATESLGSELNQRMYGASDGVRSFIKAGSAINSTTLFLANSEEAQLYEPKMRLQFINPSNGAVRTGGTGYVVVDKVDPIAATLTLTGTLNAEVTSVVAGDGIVRWSMNTKDLDGLKGWCPVTVGPSDSYLGVNRSIYRTRLAGVYHDASNITVRSGLLRALGVAKAQVGSKFKKNSPFFCNPTNLTQIRMTIEGAKAVEKAVDSQYGVGIEMIEVMGYSFIEDPHCPVNEMILVAPKAWTRGSCGKQPQIDNQDGNRFWYNRSTGKLEFAMAHDGNTYSYEPYNIMRVTVGAAA